MNIEFTSHAWEEFNYWLEIDTLKKIKKIKEMIKAIKQNPFKGTGKPVPLKYDLKGFWSRRTSSEHRLVYKVLGQKGVDQKCVVVQCRFHYDDK